MGASEYVEALRASIGRRLLLLPGVCAVIHDDEGRLLLQRRTDDGTWSLPAGAIDPGERPADAVVREVREETGLDVRPRRILGVFGGPGWRIRYPNGDETEYTAIVFHCEIVGGRLTGGSDGESAALRWFRPEKAPAMNVEIPVEVLAGRVKEPVFDGAQIDGGNGQSAVGNGSE